jgi:hypothetical protein
MDGSQDAVEQPRPASPPPCDSCPLCLHLLHEPVLTECGHTFCALCFARWADSSIGRLAAGVVLPQGRLSARARQLLLLRSKDSSTVAALAEEPRPLAGAPSGAQPASAPASEEVAARELRGVAVPCPLCRRAVAVLPSINDDRVRPYVRMSAASVALHHRMLGSAAAGYLACPSSRSCHTWRHAAQHMASMAKLPIRSSAQLT